MHKKIKEIALCSMLAAMIFVLTLFVKFPLGSGYVHLGDALLYIGCVLFNSPYVLIAGALGEGFADIAGGYTMYFPATAIIKVLVAVPLLIVKSDKLLSLKAVLMTIPSGIITVGGYFIADYIIARNYAVADIPGNVIQAAASTVIFIILAAALDRVKIKDKISIN
ncbi:MAG: ECF transporter S component [Eubacterium sp.]|nr:ECF transporter S component [Eubacterium sp.]